MIRANELELSMSRKQASINDVAAEAGVSAATVSRALRGFTNVAPSTRARVETAAKRLHYRVNPAASQLARGRSSTVAMVVPDLDTWYFSSVMAGAEAVLTANGYELAAFVVGDDVARERLTTSPMLRGAEGVILVDVDLDPAQVSTLVATSGPTATVGLELDGVPSVVVDDVLAGHLATTHLLALGHSSIALVGGGASGHLGFSVPAARREGYLQALRDVSLAARPEFDVDGNFSIRGGYEAMSQLLTLDDVPTAVFAMSDEMAFGALKAMRDHGLSVPGDVSIVGVDDHPMAWVEDLTTIAQQVGDHGALVAQVVLDLIEGRPISDRVELRPSLVVRGSTARLA